MAASPGHDAAGTRQIANESAEKVLKEIVDRLSANTTSSTEEPVLV